MYVIEITTDKTFEALTVKDGSTNYNQVCVYALGNLRCTVYMYL